MSRQSTAPQEQVSDETVHSQPGDSSDMINNSPDKPLYISTLRFACSFAFKIHVNYEFCYVCNRYGDGYTVTLRIGGENPNLEAVSEFIKSLFPSAVLKVSIALYTLNCCF